MLKRLESAAAETTPLPRHTVLCRVRRSELDGVVVNRVMVRDHFLDNYRDGLARALQRCVSGQSVRDPSSLAGTVLRILPRLLK